MFGGLVVVLLLPLCLAKSTQVTFKNVTFRGYNLSTEKFRRTIPLSNDLKDFLSESPLDKIEFVDQNIPVLYENSLADLDEIEELVLENCGIFEIQPGTFKNVPVLRNLSLKGNKIEEIREGVFNHLNLSKIDLSLNLISAIHSNAFNDLPNLLSINLAHNSISKWNKNWFKNTPLLTRISMKNNTMDKLPSEAFRNLAGSKSKPRIDIDLSHNKIKTIDPKAFRGLTEVKNLWLGHNRLEEFGEDLLEGVDVKYLWLNNNNIRCLEGDLAKIIKAEINQLDFNPYDCVCVEKIWEWKEKNNNKTELSHSYLNCLTKELDIILANVKRVNNNLMELDKIRTAKGQPKQIK